MLLWSLWKEKPIWTCIHTVQSLTPQNRRQPHPVAEAKHSEVPSERWSHCLLSHLYIQGNFLLSNPWLSRVVSCLHQRFHGSAKVLSTMISQTKIKTHAFKQPCRWLCVDSLATCSLLPPVLPPRGETNTKRSVYTKLSQNNFQNKTCWTYSSYVVESEWFPKNILKLGQTAKSRTKAWCSPMVAFWTKDIDTDKLIRK